VYRAVLVLLPSWLTGKAFIDHFKRTVLATALPTRTHQALGGRSRGVNGERRGRFQ
jgi:hypothetical protein